MAAVVPGSYRTAARLEREDRARTEGNGMFPTTDGMTAGPLVVANHLRVVIVKKYRASKQNLRTNRLIPMPPSRRRTNFRED